LAELPATGPQRRPTPEPTEPSTLATIWSVLGGVVAPASLVGALLFYFGYVSAHAQYVYFGVDVDTLGFSTQDFVMRAPQPLLVPVLLLLVSIAAALWTRILVGRRFRSMSPAIRARLRAGLAVSGTVALGAALILLLAYPAMPARGYYDLVTPLVLGLGAGLLVLAVRMSDSGPGTSRSSVVVLVLVVIASVFWATATLAEWSGTGRAKALARELPLLPAVVVDTSEPLFPGDEYVVETTIPGSSEQTYRFRYRGLRLLAEGDGRLFLVPERWSPSGSTFVVPMDDARIRFRFVNDPPWG